MGQRTDIDVFDYLDYRAFLRDTYLAKKDQGRGFSFRRFSQLAGLRSPNHLKRVMDGERGLTPEMAVRYADALKLKGDAHTYFCDLVTFGQAKRSAERNAAYRRLTGFRGYRKAHKLELEQAAYHGSWYIPAIREMVLRPDFEPDAAWIAKRMIPPITVPQAAEAIETLLSLGMLERDPGGSLVQGETVVTTGPETRGLHIVNYHHEMMRHAAESIDRVPSDERDISSLTLCLGENGLRRIKERVQRFRKELIALATLEQEGTQVVQLNMQLFPLTVERSGEGEQK